MYSIYVGELDRLCSFRDRARDLLAAQVEPASVTWSETAGTSLFAERLPVAQPAALLVPRAFATLAEAVVCHREPRRWALLYEALWRIAHGERCLLDVASDPLTHRLQRMAAAVKHDQHRMTAFVRFRVVRDDDGDHRIAWYQPEHRTLRRTASFFIDRFARLRFSILTPDLTLHWDGVAERFSPGRSRREVPAEDAVEASWQRYYNATFNPARLNSRLMVRHMPKRYWQGLPETAAIPDLMSGATARTDRMVGAVPRTVK
jgi:probable DNA metabolism protein